MCQFLLDTNICIYLIKNRSHEVLEKFRKYKPKDIAISSITVFELEYGIQKSQYPEQSRKALSKFLIPLNMVMFDEAAASESAVIRAELEKRGTPIGPFDLLIAGIAQSMDMTLVTNNIKEFNRVKKLKLENWAG
jgi:tRNA(fMet)-specific endonuclease VapC